MLYGFRIAAQGNQALPTAGEASRIEMHGGKTVFYPAAAAKARSGCKFVVYG